MEDPMLLGILRLEVTNPLYMAQAVLDNRKRSEEQNSKD
jgi:hypothetical protein